MPRRGRSNTMVRRYKGRPDTFWTDLVYWSINSNTLLEVSKKILLECTVCKRMTHIQQKLVVSRLAESANSVSRTGAQI